MKGIGPRGSYSWRAAGLAAAVAALCWCGAPALAGANTWPPQPYPSGERVDAAQELAAGASGTVAFAVADPVRGVRGYDEDNQFSSASVSKVLLLAAELRKLRDEGSPLDDGTKSLLEPMITFSDNDAASAVYSLVGDGGMEEAARRAGMRSFSVTPGYWGGAQVTAADLTRFYLGLDRNLVGPHERYAKGLLADITSSQRWGIPDGAGHRWDVYFKGGWRPVETDETSGPVTHQAGLLEHDSGQRVAIAVLTDLPPGETSYSVIEGITERLLREPPRTQVWPAP